MKKFITVFFIFLLMFAKYACAGGHEMPDKCLLSIHHDGGENYFHEKARPGETVEIGFRIKNETKRELSNYLLVYDSLTAVNGGNRVLNPENQICGQTALWFDENREKINLNPGVTINRKLIVNVPEDAGPGLYTAIVALYSDGGVNTLEGEGEKRDFSLQINNSYSTTLAAVIEIEGEMERKIQPLEGAYMHTDKQNGKTFVMIPLLNPGDTYEFPKVRVKVEDGRGGVVCDNSVNMNIFYRHTETYAAVETTGLIKKGGKYHVDALVEYGKEGCRQMESAEYEIEAQNKIIKSAEKTRILNNSGKDIENSGFFIIGRSTVLWAGGTLTGALLIGLLVYVLSRRKG